MLIAMPEALVAQQIAQHAAAGKRMIQAQLVYPAHECKIGLRFVSTVAPNGPASPAPVLPVQSAAPTAQTVAIQNTGPPIGPVQVTTSIVNQLRVSTIQSQTDQLNLVRVGAGNTFALNMAELPEGTLNIIQNTLDNQTIRQSTTIQINANILSVVRMMNLGALLQRQIAGSLK